MPGYVAGQMSTAPSLLPAAAPEAPASVLRAVMPELDTLRGLAVAMVVYYHAFWSVFPASDQPDGATRLLQWSAYAGWTGVPLFFVLSGFLITGILLETRARPDYFKRFYWRRILRILPPYLLVLLILAVTGLSPLSHIGLALVFLANMVPAGGPYSVLWSLAVEEHFYLFWPLVVRRLPADRLVAFAAGAMVAIIPLVRLYGHSIGHDSALGRFTWYTADGLAMGACLALLARTRFGEPRRMLGVGIAGIAVAGALLAGLSPWGVHSRYTPVGAMLQNTILSIGFAGTLATFLAVGSGPWAGWVRIRPLQTLGLVSYGLYLYHMLCFEAYDRLAHAFFPAAMPAVPHWPELVTRAVVVGAVSLGVAWVSRWTFEEAFLRQKDRLG